MAGRRQPSDNVKFFSFRFATGLAITTRPTQEREYCYQICCLHNIPWGATISQGLINNWVYGVWDASILTFFFESRATTWGHMGWVEVVGICRIYCLIYKYLCSVWLARLAWMFFGSKFWKEKKIDCNLKHCSFKS